MRIMRKTQTRTIKKKPKCPYKKELTQSKSKKSKGVVRKHENSRHYSQSSFTSQSTQRTPGSVGKLPSF